MEFQELIECEGPRRGRPRLVSRRYSVTPPGPSTTAIVRWTKKGAMSFVPRERIPIPALVGDTFGPPVSWGHVPRSWREIKVWASDEGLTLELHPALAAHLRLKSPRTTKYEYSGSRWLGFDWTQRPPTDWDYPDRLSGSWSDPAERDWLGPHPMLYVQCVEPGRMLCSVEFAPAKGSANVPPPKLDGYPPVMMYRPLPSLDDMEIIHEGRPWAPITPIYYRPPVTLEAPPVVIPAEDPQWYDANWVFGQDFRQYTQKVATARKARAAHGHLRRIADSAMLAGLLPHHVYVPSPRPRFAALPWTWTPAMDPDNPPTIIPERPSLYDPHRIDSQKPVKRLGIIRYVGVQSDGLRPSPLINGHWTLNDEVQDDFAAAVSAQQRLIAYRPCPAGPATDTSEFDDDLARQRIDYCDPHDRLTPDQMLRQQLEPI